MKRIKKVNESLVSLVKIFLLLILFLQFSINFSHADTGRVEQLIKTDVSYSGGSPVGVNGAWGHNLQRVSCADFGAQLQTLTFSLEGGNSGHAQAGIFGSGDPILLNNGGMGVPLYITETLLVSGAKKDYTFTFSTPVDLSQVCQTPSGYFYLSMRSIDGGFLRYGSNLSTSYRDSNYDSVSANVNSGPADWYFIINGVAQLNHAPVFLAASNVFADEGSRVSSTPLVLDIDGGNINVTATNLPEGATFIGGKFIWTPRFDQAGIYYVTFAAQDDGNQGLFPTLSASSTLLVTVYDSHPVITTLKQSINNVSSNDGSGPAGVNGSWGQNLQRVACADVGSVILNTAFSLEGGNSGYAQAGIFGPGDPGLITNGGTTPPPYLTDMVLVSGAKKDYTFTFPSPVDMSYVCPNTSGYFYLTMRTLSGGVLRYGSNLATSYRDAFYGSVASYGNIGPTDWYFIINNQVNTAPILTSLTNQTVAEGQPLTFPVTATDSENDPLTLIANGLPAGAIFDAQTGAFSWTPGYTADGTYQVTFTATENTPTTLSDSKTVTITVSNTNRPPVITPIANQTVDEGHVLQFTVSATDPDGNAVTLSANNLPAGATFTPATGIFSWTPGYAAAGNYPNIEFTATDNGTPIALDVALVTVTVGDINRMPDITTPGPQEVLEGHLLTFSVSATDPDNDVVTLNATGLPTGSTFNPSSGTFSWTPNLTASGVYTVTITATDNGIPSTSRSTDVVITVGNNPTPVEQSQTLVNSVVAYNLPTNVQNSYLANLQKIEPFITDGQITPAINQLNAFLIKLQKDYQKGIITQAQYNTLRNAANKLIADLT